jgi:thiamine biosynthesis protein ThiS
LKVLLYGTLRSLAGKKEHRSGAPTVDKLVEELSRAYGEKMRQYLCAHGNTESLTLVLNGKVIPRPERDTITLGESDTVELLSPIGGG